MTSTVSVSMTLAFDDLTERNVSIDGVSSVNLTDVKNKIDAINADSVTYAPFYNLFVSNGGSSFVSVSSARIVTVEEEVIYNG